MEFPRIRPRPIWQHARVGSLNARHWIKAVSAGASLSVASLHQNQLSLDGTLALRTDAPTSIITSLTLGATGKLDLANSDIIITNGAAEISTIAAAIKSADDAGSWDGPGISSSATGTPGTALGYADNSVWNLSIFENQQIPSTAAIVKFTWDGDANLDGQVNNADLTVLLNGPKNSLTGWYNGDFNYDSVINADDFALFALGNAMQTKILSPPVPEPNFAPLLVASALTTLRRRKH